MSVTVYKKLGRYDLCSTKKEWQVVVRSDSMSISECWPEDDEPDVDHRTPPSEAIEMIAERMKAYWIDTAREEKETKVRWFRENAAMVDHKWAKGMIASLQKQIDGYRRYLVDEQTA